jgi:type IV secretory pathway TrbL component
MWNAGTGGKFTTLQKSRPLLWLLGVGRASWKEGGSPSQMRGKATGDDGCFGGCGDLRRARRALDAISTRQNANRSSEQVAGFSSEEGRENLAIMGGGFPFFK